MNERLKLKLASWIAKSKGGPTGSKFGSLANLKDREHLVILIEEARVDGVLPDLVELRRYLIGTLGVSLKNADDICDLFGKFEIHP